MEYDYVIVGGGSAGCVLAARLSELPQYKVLLLEAGTTDKKMEIHVPAAFSKLMKTEVDWNFSTVPQEHMYGRQLYQPRGKVLGGSSSINAMIYIRGHQSDFDYWASLGNRGWAYEEVLPFFKKSEDYLVSSEPDAYHARGGKLAVSSQRYTSSLTRVFVEAATSLGHPFNHDFNGNLQDGFGYYDLTIKNGKRHSTARAFLKEAMKRPNLHVITGAHVQKLNLTGQRVTGLVYNHQSKEQQAEARREVILSAGTFGSPQILMASGIGPAEHLKQLGIPVLHHLPGVGENLHDHLIAPIVATCSQPITLDSAETIWNLAQALLLGKGPLTSNVAEGSGFIRTNPNLPAPDIQYHFGPAYFVDHGLVKIPGSGYSLGPTLLCPESRGTLRLAESSTQTAPLIDPRYYSHEADLRTMLAGFREAMRIMDAPAFRPYFKEWYLPAQRLSADEEIVEHLRRHSETLYHPVGTCKMGHDAQAVVTDRLLVHGLAGLRVADASVMPRIVRGNTNAATIMIAEKAASFIKEEA